MSTTDAQLLQLFEEIDADESGLLDREEVAELAESLGAPLSTAELDDAMLQMDEDGSGEVDFDEFASWFRKLENSGAEEASPPLPQFTSLPGHCARSVPRSVPSSMPC